MGELFQSNLIWGWFRKKYPEPTPAQVQAWPLIHAGHNVLIVSPTGTGKTFAAFLAVLDALAALEQESKLRKTIYAIYVSPLRALSYDLEKNLNGPLRETYGEHSPIRVGLRTGDTSPTERQRQFVHPPHILLTTPESLALLLSQSKWLPLLATARWMIVDEIHALAENKRGAHLSLSMERLQQIAESNAGNVTGLGQNAALVVDSQITSHVPAAPGDGAGALQRIGLSATVAPLTEVAQFLAGTGRACEIVDASTTKKIDLRVYSPLGRNPYPPSGYTGQRLIRELARLILQYRTTVVFTNTRSGAEAATFWLIQALPELASQIECHHASLDRDVRQEVEDRLKRGELRAVICSTSLELGIDIGSIDLVVMLSTPKGVSRALQRTGRAGHNIHAVSRGLLMATNLNDLVECCATVLLARQRHLDAVRLPHAPLDVLAQHLVSMGCIQTWKRSAALALIRRAYPYRDLTDNDFNEVLDYLAGGGKALRQQYTETFGKIVLDEERFQTRSGRVQRDLLQNIGVIPNEGVVRVKLKGRTLGMVEEIFVRQLQVGDVFIIAGRPVRLERNGLMECFVSRADHATPTVPRWNANKMPLSNRVAVEIVDFRSQLRKKLLEAAEQELAASEMVDWIDGRLDCGSLNAEIIFRMHLAQFRLSDIPTADFLLVEELSECGARDADFVLEQKRRTGRAVPHSRARSRSGPGLARHYFFHSLIGRAANDALSRVVARRLSRLRGGNAIATPDDYGFVLTVTHAQQIRAADIPVLLAPEDFANDLDQALSRSDLLKYHFRNAAQTGMMVYRNYFGEQKSVRKLQWSSEVIFNVLQQYEPDHVLLREARRDAVHTYIDLEGALAFVNALEQRRIELRTVDRVPPLSFAMFATKIKEALLVEDPREMMERLFHHWWSQVESLAEVKR
ncbi:MAG: DEAD/DEAH box helicase [Verrucomicrobiota bacterium]